MTAEEFNREFDLMYNNVMSDMAPGLDGYEKSVFLTLAQEEVVKQLYSGTLGDGFESSELNRRYLANLIRQGVVTSSDSKFPSTTNGGLKLISGYRWYTIPLGTSTAPLLVLLAEQAECSGINGCCDNSDETAILNVQPVKYDEINKVLNNPFRRPNNTQALRADINSQEVVIITHVPLMKYTYEYLKKPYPIIVEDLSAYTDAIGSPITIDGHQTVTRIVDGEQRDGATGEGSELDSALHRTILKYAVQLAAASWASNNKS